MSLKDIEKLKEKVEKDPDSKLFVPLAEEYRKEGMLDEAIAVLLKGLEKQPGYASARVSLGKIYLEKGLFEEARTELEIVASTIPDNLFAHKKLAEIYSATGEKDLAIQSFKNVLKLNPMDEEALNKLKEIEGAEGVAEAEEISHVEPFMPEEPALPEDSMPEMVSEMPVPEDSIQEEMTVEETEDDSELADFKASFMADTDAAPEVSPSDEAIELLDEAAADEDVISFGDIRDSEETVELELDDISEVQPSEEVSEGISFEDIGEVSEAEEAELEAAQEGEAGEILPEGISFEDIGEVSESGEAGLEEVSEEIIEEPIPVEEMVDVEMHEPTLETGTVEEAEKFIAEGRYVEATDIYKNILSSHPDDKKVLQRAEELKTLLKLMGKDKEALISRLNDFLDAINKRRDEFFRGS